MDLDKFGCRWGCLVLAKVENHISVNSGINSIAIAHSSWLFQFTTLI